MRLLLALLLATTANAHADPVAQRGQILYTTHCIECHTVQMHWRERRLAVDVGTLRDQVRRWQGEARLGWTDEEVEAVTRHLNDTVYRFPQQQRVALGRR